MFKEPIYVTQPTLPDFNEYLKSLKKIYKNKYLTNGGEYHNQLENELKEFLGVKYLSLFSNGTLALITALKVLRIVGEVITTPYSFVATSHALKWNGINPVFVDIEPQYCNLDPAKIEAAITPNTSAILPVHVYGNPCEINKIQEIADIYGLKVIYDAAHAFGVKIGNSSILNYGDMSILSFHATKVFNTIEGGAIICHDEKTKQRIDYAKNFGFADEITVVGLGINAKMNELQAAFGLPQLKTFKDQLEKRKIISEIYRNEFQAVNGIRCLEDREGISHNYAYFPIFIDKEEYGLSRDDLYNQLKYYNVYGRRYFYPLITSFHNYRGLPSASRQNLPVASQIAEKVICLPIFPDLEAKDTLEIAKIISSKIKRKSIC